MNIIFFHHSQIKCHFFKKGHCSFLKYFKEKFEYNSIVATSILNAELEKAKPIIDVVNFSDGKKELSKKNIFFKELQYIIKNVKKIDVLFCYHFSTYSKILCFLYKMMNKAGVTYIKMDCGERYYKGFIGKFKLLFNSIALKYIDIMSNEIKNATEHYKKLYSKMQNKIINIPNPIKTDIIQSAGFANITTNDKENLIITVARIGSDQKNNEMMLNALDKIDMKGWKFAFIGDIEESFKIKINDFLRENPNLKDYIIFTEEIIEPKQLYDWYRRAKVFCLTSKFETFCNAQTDSLYFGCYNISTPVSGVEDMFDNWRFGAKIENVNELRNIFKKIFDREIEPMEQFENIKEYAEKFYLSIICEKLKNAIDCYTNKEGEKLV